MYALLLCLLFHGGTYQDPGIQYMTPEDARKWVNALPAFTSEEDLALLLSRPLIPYTHKELPRVLQDVGNEAWNGDYRVDAPKTHNFGSATLDPQWRFTAGASESTVVVHYMSFPDTGHVDVWQETSKVGNFAGLQTVWRHRFPVGMTFMEAIFNEVDGELLCTEIRTRRKVTEGHGIAHWSFNRFSPCRDSSELEQVSRKVTGKSILNLFSRDRFKRKVIDFSELSPRFNPEDARFAGYEVVIPKMEPELVKAVLRSPFKSTKDHEWEVFEDGSCSSVSTQEKGQIVPPGYNGAFFPTNKQTCNKCHRDDMQYASTMGPLDWYGFPNGDDTIRSWTPLAPILGSHPTAGLAPLDPRITKSPRIKIHQGR